MAWRISSIALRLSSPSGQTVEYVAGLYYFHAGTYNRTGQIGQLLADLPLIGACPVSPAALCGLTVGQYRETDTKTESAAVFGQATIHATDRLRLIVGGRLGHETVRGASTATTTETGAFFSYASSPAIGGRTKDDYFIYRLGAQYDVTPDLMVFGTYSLGYKGAAINDGATTDTIPLVVRAEKPKAGEIGFKATILEGRAAFNATAFYIKVSDFQAQFYDPDRLGFVFGNAPSLTSKGVTASLFGRPLPGLTANVGATYNDARYGAGYLVTNAANAIVDAHGKRLSPKWKFTASTEYAATLGGDLDGFVQADMVYRSRSFSNAANDPILNVDGAAIFGGRIGLRSSDGQVGVSIFARNIFNTFRPAVRFATPTAAQQLDPASFSQFEGPEARRSVGLSLDVRF